ncbi:hypothetical protein [Henriciella marina]|uniref:hypothetical protein n=1 Tax=Henriciella marina TaxID=453851 RepID=UPI0003717209|nr:hypothetical protein [Henriciella marina]
MKRTLLTATAAIALMATPAIAQAADADVNAQTEAEITTDVPDVQIEGGTEMDTMLETETPSATTPSWDGDSELDTQPGVDDGMGGEYYESEEDAIADSDLETGTDVEIDTPALDAETDTQTELDVETKTETNEDFGQGGNYYENKEAAEADADLYSDEVDALKDEKDVEMDVETDVEAEATTDDGMGGPEAANRDDAATRYSDINEVSNPDVDVDGLTEYEEEQIEEAGEDAAQDIDKLEKDSLNY